MSLLSWYQRLHLRVFNIGVRVFGLMALVVGSVFGAWGVFYAINPQAARNVDTAGLPIVGVYAAVAVFCSAVGVAALRVSPYRPDLGDRTWSSRTARPGEDTSTKAARSWWTGDIKARKDKTV